MTVENVSKLTASEIRLRIRADKDMKKRISGYSSMKVDELRQAYEKGLKGEVVKVRSNSQNPWVEALNLWNKGKGAYTIPKKGSSEHDEVVKIMEKIKNPPQTKGSKVQPSKKDKVVVKQEQQDESDSENLVKVVPKKEKKSKK